MTETWFVGDHHFYHKRILEFKDKHGCLLRPEFDDVDTMNQTMVDLHNKVVGPKDTVWFLGDVTWKQNRDFANLIHSMKGKLNLCLGNHDDGKYLSQFFNEVVLWKKFPEHDFMISHVPLAHGDMLRAKRNVHGHLHEKTILKPDSSQADPRYLCVSVEQTGYFPLSLDEIKFLLPDA